MNDDMASQPRSGTTADLVRRVDRLEAGQNELSRTVQSLEMTTRLMQQEQTHIREMLQAQFATINANQQTTQGKVDGILDLIQKAYQGDPSAQSAYARQIMEEYREFQRETREGLRKARETDESFEDYILVQETRSKTLSTLATRAFGASALAAVGGIVGVILGVIALVDRLPK